MVGRQFRLFIRVEEIVEDFEAGFVFLIAPDNVELPGRGAAVVFDKEVFGLMAVVIVVVVVVVVAVIVGRSGVEVELVGAAEFLPASVAEEAEEDARQEREHEEYGEDYGDDDGGVGWKERTIMTQRFCNMIANN